MSKTSRQAPTAPKRSGRPLLDYAGAAEYLGFTEKYMRRLVAEKRVPCVKLNPSRTARVYFDPDKLDEWVAAHAVPAEA